MQELVADLCARHRPGVLLVTHDVEEAVVLADRVMVLTEGRISLDQPVDLALALLSAVRSSTSCATGCSPNSASWPPLADSFGRRRPSHARGPPEPSARRRVQLGRHLGEPAAGNPRVLAWRYSSS